MREHRLPVPEGYDPETQGSIRYLAAQLDDQLRRLKTSVEGLDVAALEWQPAPGRNTIGMLLAHIAVAEAWWMQARARGVRDRDALNRIVKGILGIDADDDGLPLPEDGGHPRTLAGLTLADYLALIDRARLATHVTLRGWTDAELEEEIELDGVRVTRSWILYHVFEHMVAHYGQILLLLQLRP